MLLKQSTAQTVVIGPILDADGVAVTTAVIGNISIAKNGSAAALTTETLTHLANGYYTLALTTSNTNTLGILAAYVNNTAMSMTVFRWNVIAAQVYDSLVSGSDLLQIDIQQLVGSAQDASRILIGATAQHEVAVTGSNHVAADVHEFQPGVITSGDFASGAITSTVLATDSITSSQIAASAVTEIQSGLALSSQAVAIKAVTDKLDTAVVLDGAVYQFTANALELGPSGSTSVTVYPLSATTPEVVIGTQINKKNGDVSPISVDVYDADGNAVDLTTQGNLEVCVESSDNVDLQVVTHGSLTIGGTGNRKVTWTPNSASVATVAKHRWSLRTASAKKVLAHGQFNVERAALSDV